MYYISIALQQDVYNRREYFTNTIMHTGFRNTKVQVIFNSDLTRATCKFFRFQRQIDNTYYCSISYEPISDNQNKQQTIFGTSQNNTVILNFSHESVLPGSYLFTVNATDGLNTTLIKGIFNKRESKLIIRYIDLVHKIKGSHTLGTELQATSLIVICFTCVHVLNN